MLLKKLSRAVCQAGLGAALAIAANVHASPAQNGALGLDVNDLYAFNNFPSGGKSEAKRS